MKKILVLLCLVCIGWMIGGCGQNSGDGFGDIYGTVNTPTLDELLHYMSFINGVEICTVYLDGEEYTNTTIDGSFCFENVPVGQHTLQVKDSYYSSEVIPVQVTEDSINISIDANLFRYDIYVDSYADSDSEFYVEICFDFENACFVDVEIPGQTDFIDYLGIVGDRIVFFESENMLYSDFGETLGITFTIYDETTNVIGTIEKNIPLPSPFDKNVELDESNIPTFSWTELDGAVAYEIYIDQISGIGSFDDEKILNENTYTLEEPLNTGEYRWYIFAMCYDTAGHPYWFLWSESERFFVDPITP